MLESILVCRSLTYAQRTLRALRAAGFRAELTRLSAAEAGDGCGYGVRLRQRDRAAALALLAGKNLAPRRVLEEERRM